jgi:hypothetical protein
MGKTIVTQGLPNKTHVEKRYLFTFIDPNMLSVPGYYVGRDGYGWPDFPEQLKWIDEFCAQTGNQLYSEQGYWELTVPGSWEELMKILETFSAIKS